MLETTDGGHDNEYPLVTHGRTSDVGITSSEATVMVLQLSRATGGVSRLTHGVLLNKTHSSKRSDSAITVGRACTKRSAGLKDPRTETKDREYFSSIFDNFVPCFR